MPQVTLPYNIQDGQDIDATPVMADFAALTGVVNGGLDADNVLTDAPSAQSSVGGLSAGSSAALSLADHKHILQGFEQLTGDPTSGNFIGRQYVDTTNNRLRFCIAVDGAGLGTWVTAANLDESDLPNHSDRHASGGPDALPSNSIDQTMLNRTFVSGTPSADVTVSPINSWLDVITGVNPTITGTQTAVLFVNVSLVNSTANAGLIAFRVLDNSSNLIAQSGQMQVSLSGGANDQQHFGFTWPTVFSTSPTLKLQVNAGFNNSTIKKSQTINGSVGSPTRFEVLVG